MANNRYSYTWADALLAMDVSAEGIEKRADLRDVEDLKDKETNRMALAKLLGLGVGSYFGGPAGGAVGKNVAGWAVDALHPWEKEAKELDVGKFRQQETRDLMKDYSKKAREQTMGQVIDVGTDAAWAFKGAGGAEGMKAAKGADEPFWSTFGSSKDDPGGYTLGNLISEFGPVEGALAMNEIMETGSLKGDEEGETDLYQDRLVCEASGGTWDLFEEECKR